MEDAKINAILQKYKDLPFVQRILNPKDYPSLDNKDGTFSTHSMSAEVDETGNWRVFPTVRLTKEGIKRFPLAQAWKIANETGDFIPFGKDSKAAIAFSQKYKRAWEPDFMRPSFRATPPVLR